MRQGGLLLWVRHTDRDNRSGTVPPEQAANHDCAAQSELTPTGRVQAQQIGTAIRALQLPIEAVRTARLCRTEDVGRLLHLGLVTDDPRLDASSTWTNRGGAPAEQAATLQVLDQAPAPGTNLVLVSSMLDIPNAQPAVLAHLGSGETAVFRPGPNGGTLLARIGASAWSQLPPTAATTTPTR
jgi:hypothetical protein